MAIMWTDDKSDVASLLDGDYRAALAVLSAFEEHVASHRLDVPPVVYNDLMAAVTGAIAKLRQLQCHHCEDGIGLEVQGWDVLCPTCASKEKA